MQTSGTIVSTAAVALMALTRSASAGPVGSWQEAHTTHTTDATAQTRPMSAQTHGQHLRLSVCWSFGRSDVQLSRFCSSVRCTVQPWQTNSSTSKQQTASEEPSP
jgi:hypothetical protein